nr:hypothetical protein [Cytophagales bacterium]
MKLLLKLKHWQLFLLTVGVSMIIAIYPAISMLANEEDRFVYNAVVRYITILPFLIYFLWIWSVGTLLNEYITDELKISSTNFFISVGVAFFILFFLFVFNVLNWDDILGHADSTFWAYLGSVMVLFVGIFAWLFSLNFVAKTLVRSERELHVNPADYYGEYIMILFFPIGIWIIQPRINRIMHRVEKTEK